MPFTLATSNIFKIQPSVYHHNGSTHESFTTTSSSSWLIVTAPLQTVVPWLCSDPEKKSNVSTEISYCLPCLVIWIILWPFCVGEMVGLKPSVVPSANVVTRVDRLATRSRLLTPREVLTKRHNVLKARLRLDQGTEGLSHNQTSCGFARLTL